MTFRLPAQFPLLPRKKNTHKGDYGHTLVLAGSPGLTGAAVLVTTAAMRSGSGLVTLGVAAPLAGSLKIPVEAMRLELPATGKKTLAVSALSPIFRFIKKRKINSVAIGPGLSVHSSTLALVRRFVAGSDVPAVLDADGLNAFRGKREDLRKKSSPLVLTPHDVEFRRLFGEKPPSGIPDRVRLAKKLSALYDVILVMKGARTIVADGPRVYVNKTGNPGMAKGGSGDVLTGILAAFIAQGLKPFEASVWAVYFHGKAGDLAVREKGELGLLASDIIEFLPQAFASRK